MPSCCFSQEYFVYIKNAMTQKVCPEKKIKKAASIV